VYSKFRGKEKGRGSAPPVRLFRRGNRRLSLGLLVAAARSKTAWLWGILASMHVGRTTHSLFKAISWLLMAALVLLTLQPIHVHVQHVDDPAASIHHHAIDLHFSVDNIVASDHQDAAVFQVTPDATVKQLGDNSLLAAMLISLLILFLSTAPGRRQRLANSFLPPRSGGYFSIAPPLRAPPLL
jgi:disulfide bond formation protein DsbB